MAMTDARDRAIVALCDTIADLRKRVEYLEIAIRTMQPTTAPLEATFPPGTQFFSDKLPMTMAEARGAAAGAVPYGPSELVDSLPDQRAFNKKMRASLKPDADGMVRTADVLDRMGRQATPQPGTAYEVGPVCKEDPGGGYVPGIGWPKA